MMMIMIIIIIVILVIVGEHGDGYKELKRAGKAGKQWTPANCGIKEGRKADQQRRT